MIKTLQTSAADLSLFKQDKKESILKVDYKQCMKFFYKALLVTSFPFKTELD